MMHLFLLLALATSPAETNKAVARRIFDEILTQGRFERAAELYAPDFVNHGATRDAGLDEDQAAARGWKKAFPDLVMTPEVVAAEGDLVAVVWHARGTNSGEGNGLPATGKRADGRGMTIWRIVDGKVKEEWSEFSTNELLHQLGLAPASPGSAPSGDVKVLKTIHDGDLVATIAVVGGRRVMSMEWRFAEDTKGGR